MPAHQSRKQNLEISKILAAIAHRARTGAVAQSFQALLIILLACSAWTLPVFRIILPVN